METPEQIVKKARPFFLNYFNKLANDMNTLTAASVVASLGEIVLARGREDLEEFFLTDRSVAYIREDGANTGDVHIALDVETSIALTGLMMMMGEQVIKNQVKTREYNEEIREGFQEVSNQVVGAMNDLVEKRQAGGHLFLERTDYYPYGEFPSTLDTEMLYLAASVDIQVNDFPAQSASWILSKGFAEALLGIKITLPGEVAAPEPPPPPPPPPP
ncbi:MAG: hypothetical protein HQL59_03300, partial [Magnetococcales bacterium]|nr:hypothetical protein [Magnetococcales bacterium]